LRNCIGKLSKSSAAAAAADGLLRGEVRPVVRTTFQSRVVTHTTVMRKLVVTVRTSMTSTSTTTTTTTRIMRSQPPSGDQTAAALAALSASHVTPPSHEDSTFLAISLADCLAFLLIPTFSSVVKLRL
jgi:hypothetical protein